MGMKKQAGDSWKQPREKYLSHRMLSKLKKAWLPTLHSHFTLTITCTFCLRHGFLAFCIWPSKTCIGLFFLYFWSLRLSLCISTSFTLLQLSDYWTIDLWLQELFHYNTLAVRTVCSPTPKKKKVAQWMINEWIALCKNTLGRGFGGTYSHGRNPIFSTAAIDIKVG